MFGPPQFLQLSSGRQIAYNEDGDPNGSPVFFFHGWPASRLQGAGFGDAARELGFRLISPDRPGIGLSTLQPGRRLLDWPPVVEEMADKLDIRRFHLVGISGGGPYTFAAAWQLSERVEAAAVISGAPPLPPEVDRAALFALYRWLLTAYRRNPLLVRWLFRCARPFATVRPPGWTLPWLLRLTAPADSVALNDPEVFAGSFACYREAWRTSAQGIIDDADVYTKPWGFPIEEVQAPVRLWHGKDDRSFSWKLAEDLAGKLPHCTARFVEGQGHYSLPICHRKEILEDLRECGRC